MTSRTLELSQIALRSTSSRRSVDRAPTRYSGGHVLDSCQDFEFLFLCPTLALL